MTESEINQDGLQNKQNKTFGQLGLAPWIEKQCKAMSIFKPTEIQTNCIPAILEGKDCIGVAKTGSGKTAAFALPILQKLSEDPFGVFAVILTPTRELAIQITDQFKVIGAPLNIKAEIVIGGVDMMRQALELARRPHIIVATPGRLADHLNSTDSLKLDHVKFLVLDECDRLQDISFRPEIETILERLPEKYQTLLFSATFTEPKWMELRKPLHTYEIQYDEATVTKLDQKYIFVPNHVKECYLNYCVENLLDNSMIIFAATCQSCQKIFLMLKELGISATPLHSKLTQAQRFSSLARFRDGIVKVLVATDVASRGLDIPAVNCVLNYDVPMKADDYIHRVGRTARAGRGGQSLTIITQYDIERIANIESRTKKKMVLYETDEDEVLKGLKKTSVAMRTAELVMSETEFGARQKRNSEKNGKDNDKHKQNTNSKKKRKISKSKN